MNAEALLELRRLRSANGGELSKEVVLAAATPASSVLHSLFEWDDAKAGHEYRLCQAGDLIRKVQVEHVFHEPQDVVTVTVNVGPAKAAVVFDPQTAMAARTSRPDNVKHPFKNDTWISVDDVAKADDALQKAVLNDELKRLIGNLKRSTSLAETFRQDVCFQQLQAALQILLGIQKSIES